MKLRQQQDHKETLLRGVTLFETFSDDQIAELGSIMRPQVFNDKEAIITQGEGYQSTYHLIKSGRCEAHIDGVFSHTLGPGASFGETALLYDSPPIATVRAAEDSDVTAWTVSREDFQRIVVDAAMNPARVTNVVNVSTGPGSK